MSKKLYFCIHTLSATHSDITKPIYGHTAMDVCIEGHLTHKDGEDELCDRIHPLETASARKCKSGGGAKLTVIMAPT